MRLVWRGCMAVVLVAWLTADLAAQTPLTWPEIRARFGATNPTLRAGQIGIDESKAGWKGRGLWVSSGTRAPWHMETGKGTKPKITHFQLRPDPLAH